MGLFHVATVTPSKPEMISAWAPTQDWGPDAGAEIEMVGSFRFDDPEGQVGMETHLFTAGGTLFQAPLTYRPEPLAGAESSLVTTTEHTVLGTRYVYDGLGDDRYLLMLAAVAMTGQGETLGLVMHQDRWVVAPAPVRIQGGGWSLDRVPVDRFEPQTSEGTDHLLGNERFELRFHRRPVVAPRPPLGLTATWDGQDDPVLLASVVDRGA